MPAGDVVLAAIAARTTRIHLGSAVIVLSSDDPVRVFQRYSTLNAISGGRAEVILGRGSSIESFPLFGYDLADYERLFEEKTNLFAELMKGGPVTWQGTTRAPLHDQDVVPASRVGPLPRLDRRRRQPGVGHPRRALRLLADARDHRRPARPLRTLLAALPPGARRSSGSRRGRSACTRPATSPRPTSRRRRSSGRTGARRITRVSKERGFRPPTEGVVRRTTSAPTAPSTSARPRPSPSKIVANLELLGASRFDLKFGMPGLTHDQIMTTIELYGTQVIPRVRELVGDNPIAAQPVTESTR